MRTIPPPEKRRPGIQCVSIDVESILRKLTHREGPWTQVQAPDSADCTTFHYICQELDALVQITEGWMLVWCSGIALYNGYYLSDSTMSEFVYVSDVEEVSSLERVA